MPDLQHLYIGRYYNIDNGTQAVCLLRASSKGDARKKLKTIYRASPLSDGVYTVFSVEEWAKALNDQEAESLLLFQWSLGE